MKYIIIASFIYDNGGTSEDSISQLPSSPLGLHYQLTSSAVLVVQHGDAFVLVGIEVGVGGIDLVYLVFLKQRHKRLIE